MNYNNHPDLADFWLKMAAQSGFLENFLKIVDFVLFGLETNFLGWGHIILKIGLSIAYLY